MADVSIIMAVYNGEKYIGEQIESILASHYDNFKLYIYDDRSNDGTKEIISKYINEYPDKIKYSINRHNMGSAANFMNGLIKTAAKEESTPYYMFCDQDDVWFPDKIGRMVRRMKRMEKAYGDKIPLMAFSDAIIVDEHLNVKNISFHASQKLNVKKRDFSSMLIENKCSGCMMIFNRALAKMVKSCPENIRYHDWWIALIATAFGYTSYINAPAILYRQHGSNVVGSVDFISDCINKFLNPKKQREAVSMCTKQAEAFAHDYYNELSKEQREIINAFIMLPYNSFYRKRKDILKYRFFKSTFVKDAGIMINI